MYKRLLRVSAHPRFLVRYSKHPWALTRENTVRNIIASTYLGNAPQWDARLLLSVQVSPLPLRQQDAQGDRRAQELL